MDPGAFSGQRWMEDPQNDPWRCTASVRVGSALFGVLLGVSKQLRGMCFFCPSVLSYSRFFAGVCVYYTVSIFIRDVSFCCIFIIVYFYCMFV